jgi:hypothetical protein
MEPIFDLSRPFPNSYWVLPNQLLAGEYPGSLEEGQAWIKLNSLIDCNIDFFLDLTRPGELQTYEPILGKIAKQRSLSYLYHRSGIVDFHVPHKNQMQSILDTIDAAVSQGRKVYLHCWGGVGRTGTVIGCYLVRHGLSGNQALEAIARLRQVIPPEVRRTSPEGDDQFEMVRNWIIGK